MAGSSLVRGAHFYRKVPRELTEGTALGGLVSLTGILVSGILVYTTTASFIARSYHAQLELDVATEELVDLAFNVTMERLPCRFTSVDLFDETGTKRLNISQHLRKVRISSVDGRALSAKDEEAWYDELPQDEGEALTGSVNGRPLSAEAKRLTAMSALVENQFEEFVQGKPLVLVSFAATWCPWSRKLEPIWDTVYRMVATSPYLGDVVAVARVDCVIHAAQPLCKSQAIHAFPTIRVYREHNTHSHEEYHGDRDAESIYNFIEEAIELGDPSMGFHPLSHLTHISGEGCQVWGRVQISRVPGSLRISARSSIHSFDPLMMNVTHHVDSLVFLSPKAVMSQRLEAAALAAASKSAIGEASLRRNTFVMHEQAMTLKHYLKVVPTRRVGLDGDGLDTYEYSTYYNEFLPKDLRPHAHEEHQRLVPNTVFSYEISPYRVVHRDISVSWGEYLTQLCAVVGGVFTVFGLIDGMLHTGIKAVKND